jgi:hypothetical protein
MEWREMRSYIPHQKKQERKERRKAIQKSNERNGFGDGQLLDESWSNWDGSAEWVQDDTGHRGSSSLLLKWISSLVLSVAFSFFSLP